MNNEYCREEEIPVVLDIIDLARLLRISKNTAYAYVKSNAVPYVKVGRQIRFYREDVLKSIQLSPAHD